MASGRLGLAVLTYPITHPGDALVEGQAIRERSPGPTGGGVCRKEPLKSFFRGAPGRVLELSCIGACA